MFGVGDMGGVNALLWSDGFTVNASLIIMKARVVAGMVGIGSTNLDSRDKVVFQDSVVILNQSLVIYRVALSDFIIMTADEVGEYIRKQVRLLTWEQYAQRQAHQQGMQARGVNVGILDVNPSPYGGKWLRCHMNSGDLLLKKGAHVDMQRVDSSETGPHLRGVVVQRQRGNVTLHVGRAGSLRSGNSIQLKVCWLDATPQFVRMLESLVEYKTLLRDVLLGFQPGENDLGVFDAGMTFFNESLNDSQKQAVIHALNSRSLSIVHGPPGTGKTTVLLEIIQQFRARCPAARVLLSSGANVAVDHLSQLLIKASVPICRLGSPTKVSSNLHHVLVDTSARPKRGLKEQEAGEKGVVAATIHGCMGRVMTMISAPGPYDLVIVDEAAQLMESHTWAAITRGVCLVLAGDHMQLPPVVMSRRGNQELSRSMMERLVAEGHPSVLLTTQHRSNSVISGWVSEEFYSARVESSNRVRDAVLANLPGVCSCDYTQTPMVLVDAENSPESKIAGSGSFKNDGECKLAVQVVRKLSNWGVEDRGIGVISPYSAQVSLIRELLPDESQVEVGTVDGFQGLEKEVVIFSAVRSNSQGKIGFLNDSRRLNVAVSRARRQFILIGDSSTLEKNKVFLSLISYIRMCGLVMEMRGMDVE